jgi:glycine/D-amino acid oxidase-like deaminating enzyme
MTSGRSEKAVVLGAGVIGLSTALLLQEKGYKVTIVSKAFPDSKTIDKDPFYASKEAGAHWSSFASASDHKLHAIESVTFKTFWELSKYEETGIMRVTSVNYLRKTDGSAAVAPDNPWYKNLVHDYRLLDKNELLDGAASGFSFKTVTINVVKYLRWLLLQFESLGGKTVVSDVKHIKELAQYDPAVVFNCTGLGSKWLGGVRDLDLYPTRGQTILIKADHKMSITRMPGPEYNKAAYIIPRDDGTVLLGGTYEVHNANVKPSVETAKEIIQRCVEISPELKALEQDGLQIIRHGVGIRPSRAGGIRIEAEEAPKFVLVHNYGHGSYGYQSSWGSALEAIKICEHALSKRAELKSAHL